MPRIHQKLHLQHRRHTGRLLHHRHTSYHGLAIIIGLAGLLMLGLNLMARATADSIYVYATVPAPIPTVGAVITSPAEGAVINGTTLTVHGSCVASTPRVIIVLLLDNVAAGSMACDDSGQFAIPITVGGPGSYTLVAQTWTITGDQAPASAPVHFRAFQPLGSTGDRIAATAIPNINADHAFLVYGPAKDAVWTGTISGGKMPYTLVINWGDGSTETHTVGTEQLSFRHHYHVMQSYDIIFRATDQDGNTRVEHFAAVTPYRPPVATGGGILRTLPNGPSGSPSYIGIYGAYLLLLAAFGWAWYRSHRLAYARALTREEARMKRHRYYLAAKRRRKRSED